jgi:hypothetical protein
MPSSGGGIAGVLLNKLTIKVDRPPLPPAEIKKLQEAMVKKDWPNPQAQRVGRGPARFAPACCSVPPIGGGSPPGE